MTTKTNIVRFLFKGKIMVFEICHVLPPEIIFIFLFIVLCRNLILRTLKRKRFLVFKSLTLPLAEWLFFRNVFWQARENAIYFFLFFCFCLRQVCVQRFCFLMDVKNGTLFLSNGMSTVSWINFVADCLLSFEWKLISQLFWAFWSNIEIFQLRI